MMTHGKKFSMVRTIPMHFQLKFLAYKLISCTRLESLQLILMGNLTQVKSFKFMHVDFLGNLTSLDILHQQKLR